MSAARTGGFLLLLTALGVVAFALFGAIHETRIGRPLPTAPLPSAGGEPIATLRDGARNTLSEAARLFAEGRRREAAHGMDAGLRILEVASFASGGEDGKQWQTALQHAKDGKKALADGNPARTAELLRSAADSLARAAAASDARQRVDESKYEGATLLNAAGVRIGEVVGVGQRAGEIEIALGGVRDLYGFLDWGGQNTSVAADRLVFGRSEWPQPAMVVLPTAETEPHAIVGSLAQAQ